MKKGINCWSFPNNFTVEECIKNAKKAGYDGIEINMEESRKDVPSLKNDSTHDEITQALKINQKKGENGAPSLRVDSTHEEINQILEMAQKSDIPISSVATSLHWKYSLTANEPNIRQKGIEIVEKMIDAARIFHADAILVVPGIVDENVSYAKAYERALEALKLLREKAEKNKVYIGIENVWNKFLMSPIEMKEFIDKVGSPYVKSYFDVGNVLAFSYPEYWIEILSDYIIRVHVKDFDTSIGNILGFKNLLEGDVNWAKVVEALVKVGYSSYLTAELVPYKTHPELLAYDASKRLDMILNINK